MRIVALSENTATTDKLFAEHGLCLYIEHGGEKILFGAGASGLFLENAHRLGIPADEADALVLPHNHTSCAGGTEMLVKKIPSVRIFIKKSAAADCAEKGKLFRTRTGLQSSFFKSNKLKCVQFAEFSEVCPDFFLVSNEADSPAENAEKRYYIKRGKKWVRDDFSGETFAVCFPSRRKDGCVILTACSHCGIVNILKTVRKLWDVPIKAIVGGFDFMGGNINKISCSADTVKQICDELSKLDVGYIYTCHCTGRRGYEIMKETLGEQIQYLHTGEELEF